METTGISFAVETGFLGASILLSYEHPEEHLKGSAALRELLLEEVLEDQRMILQSMPQQGSVCSYTAFFRGIIRNSNGSIQP